jgi:outer membrane lipoprotein-sorting protein
LNKKITFLLNIFIIYLLSFNNAYADFKKKLINKITLTQTLSFNFNQKIGDKQEFGKCLIKYPLLMKCDYDNKKKKVIISNGKSVAIIKKKYKKIYRYPIKTTPLFIILDKKKILKLVRQSKPILINSNLVSFEGMTKKGGRLAILFDKNSLDFMGWKTKDAYSNDVNFMIENLIVNKFFEDNIFKIPKLEDL